MRTMLIHRRRLPYFTACTACVGLVVLWASSAQSFRRLSWSDEIVYAVMGRNIETRRGVNTNFYDAASIIKKGFPVGDVHMPGHAFILAFAFLVLGETETAPIVSSNVTFIVSGILPAWSGRRLFGPAVGLCAAVLFYLLPR